MDLAIGALLVIGGDGRAQSPGFNTARAFAPIEVWGLAFMLLGTLLLLAMRFSARFSRGQAEIVRVLGPTLCVMWASMYLVSALSNHVVSFIGVPSYLYLAYRHSFAPTRPA